MQGLTLIIYVIFNVVRLMTFFGGGGGGGVVLVVRDATMG